MFLEFKLLGLKVELFVAGKRGLELRDSMVESNNQANIRRGRLSIEKALNECKIELDALKEELVTLVPAIEAVVLPSEKAVTKKRAKKSSVVRTKPLR